MRTGIASLCFLMIVNIAQANAKCAIVKWDILGEINSARTQQGVEGAHVFVFLDKSESTNSAYIAKYPDFFVTGEDGRFVAASYFDPFRKMPLFDPLFESCAKKPNMVEIIVIKPGFATKRRLFKSPDFTMIEEGETRKILLPVISLDEAKRE